MNNTDVEQITKTMGKMVEYELLLADLYKACAERWPVDRDFWHDIARQEAEHAGNIRKLALMVAENPIGFEKNRPLNPIAVSTAIKGVQDVIKRLAAGEYTYEKILIVARDIEQSILEFHYPEIVRTGNVEYHRLIKRVQSDTRDHNKRIQEKIAVL